MGVKVFELAKKLGVDHREVLKKCDALNIRVRNYMSVLTDEQAQKLRGQFETSKDVIERVQAPGVVRRRRSTKSSGDGTNRRPALKIRKAAASLPPVKAAPEPAPEPVAPEAPPIAEKPPEAPVTEPVVDAPPAVETAPEPAVGAEQPKPATIAPAEAPVEAPSAEREPSLAPAPVKSAVRRPTGGSSIRKPTSSAGSAKVLGSIPLEQLQQRTARPQQRRGPGGPPGNRGQRPSDGRGPRPGGDRRGPPPGGGGRPSWRPTAEAMNNMPPPSPTDTGRRRRDAGSKKDSEKERTVQRSQSRRRQVIDRDELYQGVTRGKRGRKRKIASRKGAKTVITTPAAHKRVIGVDETISVGELGKGLGVKAGELIGKLMQMGLMVTINEQLDLETASLLASEYNYEVKNVAFAEDEVLSGPVEEAALADDPDAVLRAPVVTIMGHVDHGKTTLLDQIRSANVASGEAGGITQHIGAYKVNVNGSEVVFLDTPGHAAFTAMRARGASVTDIIVLIVAADDGVMPQTVESINHAKAAGVPLVVAVNKCDKPDVDPERIKQELTQYELVPEEWGGDTMFVNVSALTGLGVNDLVESLALQAEVLELRANPAKPAYGHIVEARIEKGRGNVCTVLVQEGTLKKGDFIVSGQHYGRVRSMTGDTGQTMKDAGPSTPIEVTGLGGLPAAGDGFHVVASEKDAKRVVSAREDKKRAKTTGGSKEPVDPMALLAAFGQPEKEKQNVILKADVAGSFEAIKVAIDQLATDEVEVRMLHGGVGPVTQSDIDLAAASEAAVLVFNTSIDSKAKRAIDQSGIEIYKYSVIYELIDGVRELMSGLLSPERIEEYLGRAEVRAVFHIQKVGSVAGCMVVDGKVVRNMFAKVMREDEEIHSGKLSTLKRVKDDVREVASGMECGLTVDGYKDVQVGDLVEVYEVTDVRRTID